MITIQPGHVENPERSIRWHACKNVGKETAPPFALMALPMADKQGGPIGWAQENLGGQVVWFVQKPDLYAEISQLAAMLCVNGPTPIPPDGYGRCTQDWPAQVLNHDSEKNEMDNGVTCGPKHDSWRVWRTGDAFVCLSHDAGLKVNFANDPDNCVWIAPSRERETVFSNGNTAQTVEGGAFLKLPLLLTSITNLYFESYGNDLRVKIRGTYLIGAYATVSSVQAPRGAIIGMQVFVNNGSTPISTFRLQDTDIDQYGVTVFISAENMSMGGPLTLFENDVLSIANTGMDQAVFTNFGFWIVLLGRAANDNVERIL